MYLRGNRPGELLYSKSAGNPKASEVNRLRIYVEIARERFEAEALRALEDLERASAKEAKEEKPDVKLILPIQQIGRKSQSERGESTPYLRGNRQ